jgi:hypothetical protein
MYKLTFIKATASRGYVGLMWEQGAEIPAGYFSTSTTLLVKEGRTLGDWAYRADNTKKYFREKAVEVVCVCVCVWIRRTQETV